MQIKVGSKIRLERFDKIFLEVLCIGEKSIFTKSSHGQEDCWTKSLDWLPYEEPKKDDDCIRGSCLSKAEEARASENLNKAWLKTR